MESVFCVCDVRSEVDDEDWGVMVDEVEVVEWSEVLGFVVFGNCVDESDRLGDD